MRIIFLMALFLSSSICVGNDLVLTGSGLGELELKKGALISIQLLQDKFPNYKIRHQIIPGISKKYHHIKVSSESGEFMFSIRSFFDEKTNENSLEYDIDQLVIYSSKIPDQFGIKVGDNISEVFSARGKSLEFLAPNLFRNAIGKNLIYYQFKMPPNDSGTGSFRDPKSVTMQEAVSSNPQITSISWPWARTE